MTRFSSVITDFIRDLLAPPGNICLTCGGKSRLTKEWPGICQRCADSIPWIVKPRCVCCGRAFGCPDCLRQEARQRSFIWNRSAVQYNKAMREWLAQYKYRGNERYAKLLIRMLSQALIRLIQEVSITYFKAEMTESKMLWKPDMITYVPVSGSRLSERGFNQAQVLAEGLGAIHRLPVTPLLMRSLHTEKQSFKTRQERIDSMKHAFAWNPGEGLFSLNADHSSKLVLSDHRMSGGLRILLVDDIYTTGSTINACAEVLLHSFQQRLGMRAEVYSLTWARS
ncbi:ComF family protein [Paenibacillus sp. SAF-054]|uniref:ComF family protein n=1 Tax=unclassified Paenibacillus TaxID=185978 RepID=UPI003F81686D